MNEKSMVVIPWHNKNQFDKFRDAWQVSQDCELVVFQQDENKSGCAATKNKGIQNAIERGADIVIVLDDDCFPTDQTPTLETLIEKHNEALKPVQVKRFQSVTQPESRGTPFDCHTIEMPVAASMGFWENIGDYCAVRQLAFKTEPMEHRHQSIYGNYFALSGMNIAFRPKNWMPYCQFIDIPRFDDIWMGWLWQKEAYRRGYCFNLGEPTVYHSRQSNVWENLKHEAKYMKENETLWREIELKNTSDYYELLKLLPI